MHVGDIYVRMFIIGIGSWDFGGQKIPWSAICKLKAQESEWYNCLSLNARESESLEARGSLMSDERPESRGLWYKSQSKSWRSKNQEHQCPKTGEDKCPNRSKKKKKSPFFHLMVYSRFPWTGWCPSMEGLSSLLSLPIQILISFGSTFTDTPINNVSSGICIP